jgi:hypothetical protein
MAALIRCTDEGPGRDGEPEEIAELFSIRRPMRSSKLLRLPQRGALGNGLRVVAGAVLASGGALAVSGCAPWASSSSWNAARSYHHGDVFPS